MSEDKAANSASILRFYLVLSLLVCVLLLNAIVVPIVETYPNTFPVHIDVKFLNLIYPFLLLLREVSSRAKLGWLQKTSSSITTIGLIFCLLYIVWIAVNTYLQFRNS